MGTNVEPRLYMLSIPTTSEGTSIMATKTEKPDAIALLKADHRKVEDLFEKFESAKSDSVKKTLAMQI